MYRCCPFGRWTLCLTSCSQFSIYHLCTALMFQTNQKKLQHFCQSSMSDHLNQTYLLSCGWLHFGISETSFLSRECFVMDSRWQCQLFFLCCKSNRQESRLFDLIIKKGFRNSRFDAWYVVHDQWSPQRRTCKKSDRNWKQRRSFKEKGKLRRKFVRWT